MASAALGAPRRSVPATKDARAEETRGLGFLRVVLMMQLLQIGILTGLVYLLMKALRTGSEPALTNCSNLPGPTNCSLCTSSGSSVSVSLQGGSSSGSAYHPPSYDKCTLETLGGRPWNGYGAWPLCSDQVPPNATVYSIGIGHDISFDIAMVQRGARIFAFDPTVTPARAQELWAAGKASSSASFTFMQLGLGASNGVVTFFRSRDPHVSSSTSLKPQELQGFNYNASGYQAAVLTLPTLMASFKHDHIDLLKVDVEGVEFDVCDTTGFLDSLDRVGQLIIEFHERMLKNGLARKLRCMKALKVKGFHLVKQTDTEDYVFSRVKPNATIVTLPQRLPWLQPSAANAKRSARQTIFARKTRH